MDQQEQDQLDSQLENLKNQLREAIAVEDFWQTDVGRLFHELATKQVQKNVNDLLSDKFIGDHQAYLASRAEANAYKQMLKLLQLASSPVRKTKLENKIADIIDGQ